MNVTEIEIFVKLLNKLNKSEQHELANLVENRNLATNKK